jgi:hypothetical protein
VTAELDVDETDLGIKALKRTITKLTNTRFTTGWQGPSGDERHAIDEPQTNAQIATWHEFGTRRMPARPVVRITYERHRREFRDEFKRLLGGLIDKRVDEDGLIVGVGSMMVTALRAEIDRSREWARPLSPSTVEAKGHNQPLVDTGVLRDRASWATRDKKGDTITRQGGEE